MSDSAPPPNYRGKDRGRGKTLRLVDKSKTGSDAPKDTDARSPVGPTPRAPWAPNPAPTPIEAAVAKVANSPKPNRMKMNWRDVGTQTPIWPEEPQEAKKSTTQPPSTMISTENQDPAGQLGNSDAVPTHSASSGGWDGGSDDIQNPSGAAPMDSGPLEIELDSRGNPLLSLAQISQHESNGWRRWDSKYFRPGIIVVVPIVEENTNQLYNENDKSSFIIEREGKRAIVGSIKERIAVVIRAFAEHPYYVVLPLFTYGQEGLRRVPMVGHAHYLDIRDHTAPVWMFQRQTMHEEFLETRRYFNVMHIKAKSTVLTTYPVCKHYSQNCIIVGRLTTRSATLLTRLHRERAISDDPITFIGEVSPSSSRGHPRPPDNASPAPSTPVRGRGSVDRSGGRGGNVGPGRGRSRGRGRGRIRGDGGHHTGSDESDRPPPAPAPASPAVDVDGFTTVIRSRGTNSKRQPK